MAFAPRYVAPSLAGVYMPPVMAPFREGHYQRNGLRGLGKVSARAAASAKEAAKAAAKEAAKQAAKQAAQVATATMNTFMQAAQQAGASADLLAQIRTQLPPLVAAHFPDLGPAKAAFDAALASAVLTPPADLAAQLSQRQADAQVVVGGGLKEEKPANKTMLYVGGAVLLVGLYLLASRK